MPFSRYLIFVEGGASSDSHGSTRMGITFVNGKEYPAVQHHRLLLLR